MNNDDASVIQRVIAGEVEDYRVLVERYGDAVYRFVYNLVGHRHEAEDITQDVFLAAYRNLAAFDRRRAKLSTWLFTIAKHRAINHLKGSGSRSRVGFTRNTEGKYSPTDMVEAGELMEQLDQALDTLPDHQRSVFVLAEIEGLSHAEIAVIEQTSVGTVKSRLHRAKRRLRLTLRAFARES